MKETTAEQKLEAIVAKVSSSIMNIMFVEGDIKEFHKYGNSLVVIFESGKQYKQPLISLDSNNVCLDSVKSGGSHE